MISSILPAILPTVGKLVDKIFPDKKANKLLEKFNGHLDILERYCEESRYLCTK